MKKLCKNNFLSTQKGFTLAEILAVAGILIILSAIVGGILVATLRGSNKTRITTAGAQNGNYAMSILTNTITNSKEFGYTDSAGTRKTSCVASTPGAPVSISRINVENFAPTGSSSTFTEITCGPVSAGTNSIILTKRDAAGAPLNTQSLLNTEEVVVQSCANAFTCTQTDEYSPPKLVINFTLIQKTASGFFEQNTEAPFKTSISIRNYQR